MSSLNAVWTFLYSNFFPSSPRVATPIFKNAFFCLNWNSLCLDNFLIMLNAKRRRSSSWTVNLDPSMHTAYSRYCCLFWLFLISQTVNKHLQGFRCFFITAFERTFLGLLRKINLFWSRALNLGARHQSVQLIKKLQRLFEVVLVDF